MKKILMIIILLTVSVYGQCLSGPISTRVGIKLGLNICTYDPGGGANTFSGTGMHFGFGMGTDIINLVAIDMIPQYRSTKYTRDEVLGRHTYSYNNLYFPIFLSLKAGMIPLVSPYIGFGIGFNIRLSGTDRFEFNNGTAIDTPIQGSETTAKLIVGGGAELKFIKFRISPEFTANIQARDENSEEQTIDYHVSLGLYYAP
ncbi:MAG: outer membrane beta-barrel protein [bacterium]